MEVKTRRSSRIETDPGERIDEAKLDGLCQAAIRLGCRRIDYVGVVIGPDSARIRWRPDIG